MQRICGDCLAKYDDTVCTTICPHEAFISDEDARRKDAAVKLLGSRVRPRGCSTALYFRPLAVDYRGRLIVSDLPGEWEPDALEVVP